MGHSATLPVQPAASLAASTIAIIAQARLRSERASVPAARALTADFLRWAGLADWPKVFDLLVCVSELVSNALFHSRSGQPGYHLTIQLEIEPGMLSVTVLDKGDPTVPLPPRLIDDTGFGLLLIREMCDDHRVTLTPAGRAASCRFALDAPGTAAGPRTVRVPRR